MEPSDIATVPEASSGAAAEAPEASREFEYDLIVIGGGSGGLACSKEAAKLGAKVALLDWVDPSPAGSKWGLGGTCVNVGCIPKKLMHQAGLLGEGFSDARAFGWDLAPATLDWPTLVNNVQMYIKSLNFGYRTAARVAGVEYENAKGRFLGPHTVQATRRDGTVRDLTGANILIAVGGRPSYLGVPGDTDCCITSDDIFSMRQAPGKTLVVGGSYIALECAGLLRAAGQEVHLMTRSIFLRGFDQEMANHVAGHLEKRGVPMMRPCVPVSFERGDDGKVAVTYRNTDFDAEMSGTYDTVLLAVGRKALTQDLGLETAGLLPHPTSGKLQAEGEATAVPHIFALGDVLHQRQELTPVAIKAGMRLARRLFGGGPQHMDYDRVPTTVFTPLEYACCGLSEEEAVAAHGPDGVDVYLSYFKPLEWALNHEADESGDPVRGDNECMWKMIVARGGDEPVLGVHYAGPSAGEVMQGCAVALKCGATKAQFDDTVGIHPTMAEEVTLLRVTKRSGDSALRSGC